MAKLIDLYHLRTINTRFVPLARPLLIRITRVRFELSYATYCSLARPLLIRITRVPCPTRTVLRYLLFTRLPIINSYHLRVRLELFYATYCSLARPLLIRITRVSCLTRIVLRYLLFNIYTLLLQRIDYLKFAHCLHHLHMSWPLPIRTISLEKAYRVDFQQVVFLLLSKQVGVFSLFSCKHPIENPCYFCTNEFRRFAP